MPASHCCLPQLPKVQDPVKMVLHVRCHFSRFLNTCSIVKLHVLNIRRAFTGIKYIYAKIWTKIFKPLHTYVHLFHLFYFPFVSLSNFEIKIFKLNFKLNDTIDIIFFSDDPFS